MAMEAIKSIKDSWALLYREGDITDAAEKIYKISDQNHAPHVLAKLIAIVVHENTIALTRKKVNCVTDDWLADYEKK